jgi:DNA-binding NarL/FixJ family response regulator
VSPTTTTDDRVDALVPRVVVAMVHPTMRRYVCDLIEQGCRCWLATTPPDPAQLTSIVVDLHPDLVLLEASRFPDCWPELADVLGNAHLLVVGPVPDDAYREAALAAGACAWISRDELPSELVNELGRITEKGGCNCGCRTPAMSKDVPS